jgi:DNA polymerase-2
MEGFLVHAWTRTRAGRTLLYLVGRLSDGRTFAAIEGRHRPWFCVRRSEGEAARRLVELAEAAEWGEAGLSTMDGEPCLRASFPTADARQKAREALASAGLRTYEADLRVADQFRIERRIHSCLRLRGPYRPGRHVDLVFLDPEVEPSDWRPALSVLSIDIETDTGQGAVLAIGLAHRDPFREDQEEVLYAGGRLQPGQSKDPAIRVFASEPELLAAFARRLRELDPDVLTGWNVVDFDLRALAERFRAHGLPFRLGRSDEEAAYLPATGGRASRAVVPGRQVWDAVRIVRAAPERYEDYTLETVAEAVLGHGKRLELQEGEGRLAAITRLAREDPEEFCRYCLQDARLVQEIFEETGLIELTLRRCQLTGVAPDLAWTSIPAFEHLYIEAMHERGVTAPTSGRGHSRPAARGVRPGAAVRFPEPVSDDHAQLQHRPVELRAPRAGPPGAGPDRSAQRGPLPPRTGHPARAAGPLFRKPPAGQAARRCGGQLRL